MKVNVFLKICVKSWWVGQDISINRSSCQEVFCKKVFLKISQISEENTCARVSFFYFYYLFIFEILHNLLLYKYRDWKTAANQSAYKKHWNFVLNLSKKRDFYNSFNIKSVINNKLPWSNQTSLENIKKLENNFSSKRKNCDWKFRTGEHFSILIFWIL